MPSAAALFVLASQPTPSVPFVTEPTRPKLAFAHRVAALAATVRSFRAPTGLLPDPEVAIGRASGARV
jgi:hypothetical protein